MASLVQYGKYGAINTIDTSAMVYYVINCFSEAYNLQDDTTFDEQIISSGEIVVNKKYLICMQENIYFNWEHKHKQQVIIIPTQTIVHPFLDVVAVKYVHNITRSVCNRNQATQDL